ncbi:HAD family hydrolase [Frankia sp. B2]|nr:HAD family hydrolase [Frankia sp. B2]
MDPVSKRRRRSVAGVRHVLFDADGVLQEIPGGWYAAMEPYLGERSREFLHRTWKDELPMLAGRGDYMPVLAATLAEFAVSTPVEDVYRDVWHRIDVMDESLALVRALRLRGYGVHLGTNQERHRAAYMRSALGYDRLFNVSCYSCDLGIAKPAPAFFTEAARRIGVDPASILFIDDNEKNIAGARIAGLAAEQWTITQGRHTLLPLLARHDVIPDHTG